MTVLEAPSSSIPAVSAVGADLAGWSSLPLLARAHHRSAPWLFILGHSKTWLLSGEPADAQFVESTAASDHPWPFADGELAGVVIDSDGLPLGTSQRRLRTIAAEARRVAGPEGSVLVVCRHRLLPRNLRALRGYGRPSAARWQRAAAKLGLQSETAGFARLDGDRVIELGVSAYQGAEQQQRADRAVLHLHPEAHGRTVVDAIVEEVSSTSGIVFQIDRTTVRKIGKTAVFVSDGRRRRYVIRIARSPIAVSRASRNFDTLEGLQGATLPDVLKRCTPTALVKGTFAGYPYFVETCVDGGVRHTASHEQWPAGAAEFITALHHATVRRVVLDDDWIARLVTTPFARISRSIQSETAFSTLGHLFEMCVAGLAGREVPIVLAHGDFTEANCLFDVGGRLAGVVDWEVANGDSLPLLDLLQLMPVGGEVAADGRWQRFGAWLTLWREPARVVADSVMGGYIKALDVPIQVIPALTMMQWATHVAERIEARRGDERWMQMRVWQPLEQLEKALGE
jgi:hypothetical protein